MLHHLRLAPFVLTALIALVAPYAASAQALLAGQLLDSEMYSPILNQYMPFRVYLPPGYSYADTQRYPTVYMLHGAGGNYIEWSDSFLPQQLDSMILRGEVQPMIVVMPDGGRRTYFANWDNGPRYSDYVAQDVVAEIDMRYRTVLSSGGRAIGGLSMGGLAALQIAMRNPNIFGIVGAHSPSIRVEPDAELWFLTGQNYLEHDPIWLTKHWPGLERLTFWVDVGDDDWWKPNIEELRTALVSANLNLTYREFSGTHEAEYWIAHVPDYLRFYSDNLRA
jgi:enterochelin esterase-like enzyme